VPVEEYLALALTPALSQREREQEKPRLPE
jgi:hypothetical protein